MLFKKRLTAWLLVLIISFHLLVPANDVKAQLCTQDATCAFYAVGDFCMPDFFCCYLFETWFAPSCYWVAGACISPDEGTTIETICSEWGDIGGCYCVK